MSVCKVRLVERCDPFDPLAVRVGRVYFRPTEEGINGDGGWIGATVKRVMSDDGELEIRFPNGPGSDGLQHIERFAICTNEKYKVGDEWLQLHRESERLMTVCSPAKPKITGTDLVLTCADQLAPLTLTRDEVLNQWCAPPRDVLDYYSRWEVPWVLEDFDGWSLTGTGASGLWDYRRAAPDPAGILLTGVTAGTAMIRADVVVGSDTDLSAGWTACMVGRLLDPGTITIHLNTAAVTIIVDTTGGYVATGGVTSKRTDLKPGTPLSVRAYARGVWMYVQVNGVTIWVGRWSTSPTATFYAEVNSSPASSCRAVISQLTSSTVERYLMSAEEPGDLHLPGAPTAGGLAGRYFMEADAKAKVAATSDFSMWAQLALNPRQEAYSNRTDTLNFAAANPPTWQPTGPAGGTWWSARWTGAIYLDLAASDRELQTVLGAGDNALIWVGKRGASNAAFFAVGVGTTTSSSLRAHLGSVTGWYPIIIEYRHATGTGGMILRDGPAGGPYSVVPMERLSPYGVFQDSVQRESHRSMIDRITQEFGYQWVIDPRTIESGQFPGRLVPRVRQGTDYDVTVEQLDASGMGSALDATDAAVRILVDAAGLATPDGAGSLFAEAWDIEGASDAVYVSTGWEAAAEITDPWLAQQRAESLQSLRTGPLETVTVNPSGRRELADTLPLGGPLERIEWEPGDGVKLSIPSLGISDRSPRQLTTITWPARPAAVGVPQGSWRSRPRGQKTAAARGLQYAATAQRNYQGQLTHVSGAIGSNNANVGNDNYSRVYCDPLRIVALTAWISDAGGVLEVNGTNTGLTVLPGDQIDVTPWIKNANRQIGRVLSPTGNYELVLEATVTL